MGERWIEWRKIKGLKDKKREEMFGNFGDEVKQNEIKVKDPISWSDKREDIALWQRARGVFSFILMDEKAAHIFIKQNEMSLR